MCILSCLMVNCLASHAANSMTWICLKFKICQSQKQDCLLSLLVCKGYFYLQNFFFEKKTSINFVVKFLRMLSRVSFSPTMWSVTWSHRGLNQLYQLIFYEITCILLVTSELRTCHMIDILHFYWLKMPYTKHRKLVNFLYYRHFVICWRFPFSKS